MRKRGTSILLVLPCFVVSCRGWPLSDVCAPCFGPSISFSDYAQSLKRDDGDNDEDDSHKRMVYMTIISMVSKMIGLLTQVALLDKECNARWRFLTYDVWPIGSVICAPFFLNLAIFFSLHDSISLILPKRSILSTRLSHTRT